MKNNNIKTQFFPYKKFKKSESNNNYENITPEATNISKWQNTVRWAGTNTQYYVERFKYYYNTYIPDIITYSQTDPELLKLKQDQLDLQNKQDQRKKILAETLNKDNEAILLKSKTCQQWHSINKKVISIEYDRGSAYYDYNSQLDIEEIYNNLCDNLGCNNEESFVSNNIALEKITKYNNNNNNNNNNNFEVQLRFEEIQNQLKLSKQINSNQLKNTEELENKLSTCNLDLREHKINAQNLNQPVIEIKNQPETKGRIFGLFKSKTQPNINRYHYDNSQHDQRNFYENLITDQKSFYENSIRMIQNRPKLNLIHRAANNSRNFISRTLSSFLLQLVFIAISLSIIIWCLNIFKVMIMDGLVQLRNIKKQDETRKKQPKKKRQFIVKNATEIARHLGPIADLIKIIRGGNSIPLKDILLSEISNEELIMVTSPVTYIVKRQKILNQIDKVLARSDSTRKTIKYYTTEPISQKFNKIILTKEFMLVIFLATVILLEPLSPIKKNYNIYISHSEIHKIHRQYDYENVNEISKLITETNKPSDFIKLKTLPTETNIKNRQKNKRPKRRSKMKQFSDLPILPEYQEKQQISDDYSQSTTKYSRSEPIKIRY